MSFQAAFIIAGILFMFCGRMMIVSIESAKQMTLVALLQGKEVRDPVDPKSWHLIGSFIELSGFSMVVLALTM